MRNGQVGSHDVNISNLSSIEQVKLAYIGLIGPEKVAEHGLDTEKIRFFSMGKELKNDLFVYSYDMQDNMVVQAMFRK
jgi:hypothetical protein